MSDSMRSKTTCEHCGLGQRILDPCPACGRYSLYIKDNSVTCSHRECGKQALAPAPRAEARAEAATEMQTIARLAAVASCAVAEDAPAAETPAERRIAGIVIPPSEQDWDTTDALRQQIEAQIDNCLDGGRGFVRGWNAAIRHVLALLSRGEAGQ